MSRLFPVAIITDEVSQELPDVVKFAKDFQLDGIEVRSLFGKAFKDFTKADTKEIRSQILDAGFKIVGCASPVFKCSIDQPSEISLHLDIFKRSVEMAYEWDCKMVRVFTFLRKSTPSTERDLEAAASHFKPLLDAVKGTDITIGVENEYSCMVGNGWEGKKFMDLVNSPSAGIVWDPCNVLFMPGSGKPVQDDFPLVADRTIHFHVKDAQRKNGNTPEHCIEVGAGELDFPAQLAALKNGGFRGYVSLETHWRKVQMSKEEAHLPAGYAFSKGGDETSRICMTNLLKMMEKIE
jgi:L-ribulose-5-phosphate 3-epimerase